MGFLHKKSLGQHFLNSPVVPGWMCDAANLIPGETVFEIGPGTGILTRELLNRGVVVVALEADARAVEVLQDTFVAEIAAGNFRLYHGDARSIDFTVLGLENLAYKCVSNIPYYLSGHLFRTLLESSCQPTDLIFLVQKEVAHRIAREEKTSILSLSTAIYGETKYLKTVKAGHFTPPPKIDSAIVAIYNISKNNFTDFSEKLFFEVVHLGLGTKRKQLLGCLAKAYDRDVLINIFSTLTIDKQVRGEDLPLATWLQLVSKISRNNLHNDIQ